MGEIFNALINGLGSVLSFFFDFLHGFMDDGVAYGLSIILLTIAINIVVFPLTLKQTRATRAFSALQPEIKRIQAEYKDDPQEMQKRLMAAQKAAGATPGGCLLPLLVQMPIWFALFRLLRAPLDHIPASSALHDAIATDNASFSPVASARSANSRARHGSPHPCRRWSPSAAAAACYPSSPKCPPARDPAPSTSSSFPCQEGVFADARPPDRPTY